MFSPAYAPIETITKTSVRDFDPIVQAAARAEDPAYYEWMLRTRRA